MKNYLPNFILTSQLILAFTLANVVLANNDVQILFDEILQNNVVDGNVNYNGIKNDPKFKEYLKLLEPTPHLNGKNEELAFWINAYNALAIKGILDKRSPSTFFSRIDYFKNAKYKVGGIKINLYDLERDVIIPFGDPRIHFAINCASLSCPKLSNHAYQAEKLDSQLDKSTKDFINDPNHNKFNSKLNIANLSKIFDWFENDFSKHSGSVQKYVAQYVNDPKLAEALRNEEYSIQYLKYDWSLNGTAPL